VRVGPALRRGTAVIGILILPVLSAGCTSRGQSPDASSAPSTDRSGSTSTSSAATATTGSGAEPEMRALAAYGSMRAAYIKSLADRRHPTGELARYVGDPLKGQIAAYLLTLRQSDIVYTGTPPRYSPQVQQVAPDSVVLRDCPGGGQNWRPIYASTGKSAAAPGQRFTPRPESATVARVRGRWVVIKLEGSRTARC
jgi:hypothetical protein